MHFFTYRSLYWRIAIGFVALLAVLLVVQGLLFVWLADRFVRSPSGRTPQQLADHVARDLSEALTDTPTADLQALVRERFGAIREPFIVLMRDGRRTSNRPDALPRGFGGTRVRIGGESPRPGRRGVAPPSVTAPIVVSDTQIGVVAVPSATPPVPVLLRELGPTLTWSGLALLAVGAAVTALVIFRPAHRRLRSLEAAALALGEGRTDVRAEESGGDEVTALARAFNRMAGDLQARADALAASDAARRQLLADVSHELMTPLTAIRGYVQTLMMPSLAADDPTRRRYLDIVDQETYKLEAIIGDLLDLARLEGGGGELLMEAVPVSDLFRRVADRHGPAIRNRGLALDVSVVPEDLTVRGDAQRLEQALQNIAANAIRHSPENGRIALGAERRGERARITIRDSGPGMPEEHLTHVFDRFFKADAARSVKAPAERGGGRPGESGSGLGLSIVRAIVQRHGGTVAAYNAPEGGAVFELMLPVSDFAAASSTVKE
jgi:signal transduction histidine kinase